MEAAADVGDLDYLLVLLDKFFITDPDDIHRKRALCLAIDQNRDDTALTLLDAGVDVRGYISPFDFEAKHEMLFPLLSAIKGNQKKLIEAILEHEPDVSHPYYIRAAAFLGDIDIVQALLSSQAAVSLRALRTALKVGNGNMLKILLDHFWRHNPLFQFGDRSLRYRDGIGDENLADLVKWAVHAKNDTMLVSFLEHGASVDRRSIRIAVRMEDPALLENLLTLAMRPGITLDDVVKLKNQTMLRRWLLEGTGSFTESAFLHAMRYDEECFEILMEAFRARFPKGLKGWGSNLLKTAIRRGDSVRLKELLAARMDVNSLGESHFSRYRRSTVRNASVRYTPLGFAIYYKKGRNIDDVQMLLDAGSEPNGIACDVSDESLAWKTPLLLALETGSLELTQRACELCSLPMVQLLLSWQANVNGEAATRAGGTALQLAAIGGSIKIAKLLLQNGADIRAPPAKVHGRNPFEGAAEHGRLDMLKVIWDATFPDGISPEEASSAIHLARTNGHRVCEQYIRYLVPMIDISELSENLRGRAWGHSWSLHRPPNIRSSSELRHVRIGDESDVEGTEQSASSDDESSSGEEDSDDHLP
ncbi:hypothetical protein E8E14_000207 [Neopestalotiopsis sp. 37M]|nr:hypothetical protein E8E14_000207 [Neopestalotiopsis sp. 37M]